MLAQWAASNSNTGAVFMAGAGKRELVMLGTGQCCFAIGIGMSAAVLSGGLDSEAGFGEFYV